jgi:hypothetical protein
VLGEEDNVSEDGMIDDDDVEDCSSMGAIGFDVED